MPEDFGLKIGKPTESADSNDANDLSFDSERATYLTARVSVVTVQTNFFQFPHSLGYTPKVLIFHITSSYSRKLPYDDGSGMRDFSLTNSAVNIRGGRAGDVFKIYIFAQPIL